MDVVATNRIVPANGKGRINSSKNNNNICVGVSLKDEDILFFQKKIRYQHNMVAQVLIYHIKLFYFKTAVGKYIIDP